MDPKLGPEMEPRKPKMRLKSDPKIGIPGGGRGGPEWTPNRVPKMDGWGPKTGPRASQRGTSVCFPLNKLLPTEKRSQGKEFQGPEVRRYSILKPALFGHGGVTCAPRRAGLCRVASWSGVCDGGVFGHINLWDFRS